MDIPLANDLRNPTLNALRALGGSGSNREIAETVIQQLQLPDDITQQFHKGGPQTELEYRLSWARTQLKTDGMIVNSQRGVWALASEAPPKRSDGSEGSAPEVSVGGHAEDEYAWRETLLDVLRKMTPAGFERLCQRLLRESGFIEVQVTGRSGDGGIDGRGIIRFAGLIGFPVLFQCKRYAGNVTTSQIRDFRGAMTGRSDRGLFITTGGFTQDAQREAARDGAPPIDLISGEMLVDKLKELELGVVTKQIESVTVNPTFFVNI